MYHNAFDLYPWSKLYPIYMTFWTESQKCNTSISIEKSQMSCLADWNPNITQLCHCHTIPHTYIRVWDLGEEEHGVTSECGNQIFMRDPYLPEMMNSNQMHESYTTVMHFGILSLFHSRLTSVSHCQFAILEVTFYIN